MHSQYDPSAALVDLARDRTARHGQRLLAAAAEFESAVLDELEEWEDEHDDGASFRRPGNFPETWRLFDLAAEASGLAAAVRHHRDLSFVLATEPTTA